jgi:hypothetical protein
LKEKITELRFIRKITMPNICNVRPDAPDLRDRIYSPNLRPLWPSWNETPFNDPIWKGRIKDQGQSEACTGFALSSMVEILRWNIWDENGKSGEEPGRISPFMLYYYALRYDDIPGEDPTGGSTARGGMKAWFRQGACSDRFWAYQNLLEKPDETEWIVDAFRTPLGAYYRVDHHSVPDLQAAINETGVVYVTAQIHTGWQTVVDRSILQGPDAWVLGGHAFLLVGYDEHGFWIQNSWSSTWGCSGFANLPYADWETNGMDAWVGQLGVPRSMGHVESLSSGLNYMLVKDANLDSQAAQDVLLSKNESIRAQQISPYIVNLSNNGVLCDSGPYATRQKDLEALFKIYLPNAVKQFGLNDQQKIDIAIYAHGGLTDENGAAQTAAAWVSGFFAKKIFPIFIMWETGFWETLVDFFKDVTADHFRDGTGAGILDFATDLWDQRLEGLASGPGTLEWDEMKKNAMAASNNPTSGLYQLYSELNKPDYVGLRPRFRLHLVGHSAGAIFHAYLLQKLIGANLSVDGIYFMAPACRIELFQELILPEYEAGKVRAYTQFYLTDATERKDNCGGVYRRSLLYLVSNAFEHGQETPILGMQKFVDRAGLIGNVPQSSKAWQWIMGPTGDTVPVTDRTGSTSHGGFSSDSRTQSAIQGRIAERMSSQS